MRFNENGISNLVKVPELDINEIREESLCQGHSSLDAPSELNPPQRIPSPLSIAPLVPQAEG